ncbi:activating transcription factor 7-interacting protein 2 isoform X2 [Stegastes partitus]|uniref:Activating transcription factor 7-interacting protein 2 isoform X2 n=1 Tax=Stegastes partitus TaxID=144197 RepID=A0A9Y4KIR2_9TELE|nr:PREDICTED: activating transcription factor 7-interacting protein 2 isoform X2 [Stegastes partitus]
MSEVQGQPQGGTSFKRPAREKVNSATKPKKRKRLPLSEPGTRRSRVNIGMALNRWRALKAAKGLNSDAAVAVYLLDVMKRMPNTSASTGADNLHMQFSRSEVQALIKQEVRSAVQKNEARLQGLIETIQQLDNGLDYEMSIKKLKARISRMSKKAEAALTYVTKTRIKRPSHGKGDVICLDSEDETAETMSQNGKSTGRPAKTEGLFHMMETTKKALKKARGFNEAVTASREDLEKKPSSPVPMSSNPCEESLTKKLKKRTSDAELNQEQPPPVLSPQGSPESKGLGRVIKEEPEDPQERENNNEDLEQFEEPKAKKLKVECVSSGSANSPSHTDRDVVQRGLLFPPLPATTFPSTLSMEAASYSIPQKLEVQLALIKNPTSLSVLWRVAEEVPSPPPMDSYTIFLTMEKTKGSGVFPDWKVLGEVKAIELPMCVLIRKHKPGHKVCAAVVGKDVFGRYGPYSTVATAAIPD